MGYMHIDNLYKNQTILLFKECFALEKIHGTSAYISWKKAALRFFSGGEKHTDFIKIFDEAKLTGCFSQLGMNEVVIFGEAYGGKCQGMSGTYGKELRFVVFDVKIGDTWLNVTNAHNVASKLGLEFVDYARVPATMEAIDAERDRPSTQAVRNGCGDDKIREGVILRPLIEIRDNRGERIIAKHKRDEFRETKTPRPLLDPEKAAALTTAKAVAEEWVTDMRLAHVLDKIPEDGRAIENMRHIIFTMIEDVYREGAGEIVESKELSAAIGARTAQLFKNWIKRREL